MQGEPAEPTRDALLLIAHGSARYPDAARPLWRHVEAMRIETPESQIEVGLLNGAPSVSDALAAITAERIRVVPFFMEAGYFTNIAIPRALGGDPRVRLCPPVGVHAGMVDILDSQARAGCRELGLTAAESAILVVGHGSANAPGRALALRAHAAELAARGQFGQVGAACLEEAPLLGDALRALAGWPVVVIGFFAGEGMHVRDDVPNAVAAEQTKRGAAGAMVRGAVSAMERGAADAMERGAVGRMVRFQGTVTDDPALRSIIRAQAALDPAMLEHR